jgi:hypothetical protein
MHKQSSTAEQADTIVIRAPAGTKARWVHESQSCGVKLSDWVLRLVDDPPADAQRYLDRFASKEPGSIAVLTEDQLRELMRKAYMAGAYRI